MSKREREAPRQGAADARLRRFAPWILAVSALAVYSNTFGVPFLFDDVLSITNDERARSLTRVWEVVVDPGNVDSTLTGRPVAAVTIAINGMLGGLAVAGYHAFNLAVHVVAGLLLYGVVRRTLSLPRLAARFESSATSLAFVVALLWLVHPLQTKAVTYIVQRVESLAALFALLTLYAFVRASTTDSPRKWFALSVVACALAMGAKESAVAVPVIVLLYDRAFLASSFRDALQQRWRWHLALAATWAILIALVVTGPRAHEATAGVAPLDYARTQCQAIVRYLGLVVWPKELVFDYGIAGDGVPLLARTAEWLPWGIPVMAALAVTLFTTLRNRAWAFVAAAFFLVLAPSSSFVPIGRDVIAEHRMYLPLAAVLVLIVLALNELLRRVPALAENATRRGAMACVAGLVLALPLAARTYWRNRDYQSDLSIWTDTAEKRPHSARAQTNVGVALMARGDYEPAMVRLGKAVQLRPDYPEAHQNFAAALMTLKRYAEAEGEYRLAIASDEDSFDAHLGLGEALLRQEKLDAAAEQFERVLALRGDCVEAHVRLGEIHDIQGDPGRAAPHYRAALERGPNDARIRTRFGVVLAQQGELDEAIEQLRRVLAVQPDDADARANLERVVAMRRARPKTP